MSARELEPGIKFAIAWLHSRANEMNDPKARQILNAAAFDLGQAKRRGVVALPPQEGSE